MKKFCAILTICVLLSVLVGCGGHVGISGKVTYSDDGSPLTVGTVVFRNGNLISRGNIQSDGTYTMGSRSAADGLPQGNYQVYVFGAEKVLVQGNPNKGIDPVTEPLIDAKYTNPETSGLSVEVKKSTRFDFKVDRYVGKKGK